MIKVLVSLFSNLKLCRKLQQSERTHHILRPYVWKLYKLTVNTIPAWYEDTMNRWMVEGEQWLWASQS